MALSHCRHHGKPQPRLPGPRGCDLEWNIWQRHHQLDSEVGSSEAGLIAERSHDHRIDDPYPWYDEVDLKSACEMSILPSRLQEDL